MAENPLDPSAEHERAVTALAEQLWAEDGRPEGRLPDYRERADELVRMERAGETGQLPNPETHPEPVEEASIQENLGEFPGAMNTDDQGDWRQTPMNSGAAAGRVRPGTKPRRPSVGDGWRGATSAQGKRDGPTASRDLGHAELSVHRLVNAAIRRNALFGSLEGQRNLQNVGSDAVFNESIDRLSRSVNMHPKNWMRNPFMPFVGCPFLIANRSHPGMGRRSQVSWIQV